MNGVIANLLADGGTLADIGHRLARKGLSAARRARDSVLRGETAAVDRFAVEWLGFKRVYGHLREAVADALLEPGWDTASDDQAMLRRLKAAAGHRHRLRRPLGETQIMGQPVAALDEPIRAEGALTRLELVPARDEVLAQRYTNTRLVEILSHFTEVEIAIIELNADGRQWASAATECGESPQVGESIRRRLNYRRRLMEDRCARRTG